MIITTTLTGTQAVVCFRINRLMNRLSKYRKTQHSDRKNLHYLHRQEELLERRLSDIWSNPEISEQPAWEIENCEALLKSSSKRRVKLQNEIEHHDEKIQRVIYRIRRWQKLQLKKPKIRHRN